MYLFQDSMHGVDQVELHDRQHHVLPAKVE